MRFLIDRCAGHLLAEWLRRQGHDVVESRELGPDPGDRALLEVAASGQRILVTVDTDFGKLVFVWEVPHAGLVRLPDVPTEQRIALMAELLEQHRQALEMQAIITIRGGRIRISQPPTPADKLDALDQIVAYPLRTTVNSSSGAMRFGDGTLRVKSPRRQ
ncbi:MAG: hypothetical protein F4Z57_10530 [Gemmatimonadetes bacterium]|nr:hypothetical protein [Gemmatimonadota bacterium]